MLRNIITVALIAAFIILGTPDWLTGRTFVCALTYPCFHANVFHLAVNLLALWTILHPSRKHVGRLVILAYAVSVLVYPLSSRPVVGISNMLFAMSGMLTPPLTWAWLKRYQTVVFLVTLVVLIPFPMFSAVTHIASFICGVGLAYLFRFTDKIMYDAERAGR